MSIESMMPSIASAESSRSVFISRTKARSITNSSKSGVGAKSVVSGPIKEADQETETNPFTVPPDIDFFVLRGKERERKQAELELKKTLKIHKKATLKSQMKAKLGGIRKEIQEGEEDDLQDEKERKKETESSEDPSWKLAITKDCQVEKETLLEYTRKKREMFLLQYALAVKRDEIQKMETIAADEEMKLDKAAHFLEEDAAMFDEFLKENDRCSVEAIKLAEKETKLKMDKMAEIKKLGVQMMNIKSDIAKNEDILKEYMIYQDFLFKLSPPEWQEKHRKKKEDKSAQSSGKEKSHLEKLVMSSSTVLKSAESRSSSHHVLRWGSSSTRRSSSKIIAGKRTSSIASQQLLRAQLEHQEALEEEEDPALYFTEPQQLLKIFTELEDQNLSLIQNSQDTEEALDDLRHTISFTKEKMGKETKQLHELTSQMKATIGTEEDKTNELQIRSQVFSFEEHSEEDQDKMLDALHRKVKEVYHSCLGDDQASLSTLQMLMYIENQMEDLLDKIELLPKEKLKVAEKLKDKERRLRLRQEKLKLQKLHQEERLRRALERAQADPKKTTGRKLIFRTEPLAIKQKDEKDQAAIDKEKDETTYFFD